MKKTKTPVRSVPRAMGKLLKEAERVKLILSANTDCYAQVQFHFNKQINLSTPTMFPYYKYNKRRKFINKERRVEL